MGVSRSVIENILTKRVDELTSEDKRLLREWWESTRSRRSVSVDLRRVGRVPVYVRTWYRHPGRYDIPGVDTPSGMSTARGGKTVKSVVKPRLQSSSYSTIQSSSFLRKDVPSRFDVVEPFTDEWFSRLFLWMWLSRVPQYSSEAENYRFIYESLWRLSRYLGLIRLLMPEEYGRLIEVIRRNYRGVVEWLNKNVVHSVLYGEPVQVTSVVVSDVSELVSSVVRSFNKAVVSRVASAFGVDEDMLRSIIVEEAREAGFSVDDLFLDTDLVFSLVARAKYGDSGVSRRFYSVVHRVFNRLVDVLGADRGLAKSVWRDIRDYYLPRSDSVNIYDLGYAMAVYSFIDRIADVVKRISDKCYGGRAYNAIRDVLATLFNDEGFLHGLYRLYVASMNKAFRSDDVDLTYMVLSGYKPLGIVRQVSPHKIVDRAGDVEYVVERKGDIYKFIIRDLKHGVVIADGSHSVSYSHTLSSDYGLLIRRYLNSFPVNEKYMMIYINDGSLLGEENKRDAWLFFGDRALELLAPQSNVFPYGEEGLLKLEGWLDKMHVIGDSAVVERFKKYANEKGYNIPLYPMDAYKYVYRGDELSVVKGKKYYLVAGGDKILCEDYTLDGLVDKMVELIVSGKYPYFTSQVIDILVRLGYRDRMDKVTDMASEVERVKEYADRLFNGSYTVEKIGGEVIALDSGRVTGIIPRELGEDEVVKVFPHIHGVTGSGIDDVEVVFDKRGIDDMLRMLREDLKYIEESLAYAREHGMTYNIKQYSSEVKYLKKYIEWLSRIRENGYRYPLVKLPKYLLQSRYVGDSISSLSMGGADVPVTTKLIEKYFDIKKVFGIPSKLLVSREGIVVFVYPKFSVAYAYK